ncbi:hypothetical protein [Propionivibrio limicola]|uniref:hypothetical protein n=1 Tax=Propionivibrio limicola TaxID=167645 RepID=UPI001291ABF6|nr:hypothetical protein [Propionivibrio limicola]
MEFLTCIVAAEEDEFPAIGVSNSPLHEWSGIESPGLDTSRVATLHAVLTGDSLQMALEFYEPVFVAGDDEEILVLRIHDALFEALAQMDEEALENVAEELSAAEVYENDEGDPEEVLSFLMALADLAQLAESQGQTLFVWIKLLQR